MRNYMLKLFFIKKKKKKRHSVMRSIYPIFLFSLKIDTPFFEFASPGVIISNNIVLKGVLHPRLVFGLFLQFSQKLQHIGNK